MTKNKSLVQKVLMKNVNSCTEYNNYTELQHNRKVNKLYNQQNEVFFAQLSFVRILHASLYLFLRIGQSQDSKLVMRAAHLCTVSQSCVISQCASLFSSFPEASRLESRQRPSLITELIASYIHKVQHKRLSQSQQRHREQYYMTGVAETKKHSSDTAIALDLKEC